MADLRRLLGLIGVRLALATIAVAVGAVGVLAALTLLAARGDVSQLARQEQEQAATATATAVADAYRASGSWESAHLHAAATLAANSGATVTVLDASGNDVTVPTIDGAPPSVPHGPLRVYSVVSDGSRVGTTIVHFYGATLPTAETHLSNALVRTVAAGAALGALLALGVAIFLSRWITRPVAALTEAVRAMDEGDRTIRVGTQRGSGELAELATAFDKMADTIARQEDLRRAVVADVAHELRTPLAILQVSSESLADEMVVASKENLSSLHEEVLRLTRIVEDLDTLASAEAGVLRVHLRPVDLAEVSARALEVIRPSYEIAGVHLDAHLEPAPALADPDRATQVLHNLLTNALKFTERGGRVMVTVTAGADVASLEVADTGTGIPPDELPHVFERFWRGKEAGRVAGSGIGLAIVDTLVGAQGGSISVTSEPSEGTRFTLQFLRAVHTGIDAGEPPSPPQSTSREPDPSVSSPWSVDEAFASWSRWSTRSSSS